MTTRNTIQLAVFLLILLTSPAQAAESLSVLLQKGIFAEETEGNLDAAIQIYEGIVKEGDANRSLVAQAQYRLGVCELKRGKKAEAEIAFRHVIDRFSDQPDLISKARERLGETGKSVSSVVVREVWSGTDAVADSISPDGKNIAFIDWTSGNLMLRDLNKGENRRLTEAGTWKHPVQYAVTCAFSRDSKQIAYSWYGTNSLSELRVTRIDRGQPRLLVTMTTNAWIAALDWSPEGKFIAVAISGDQQTGSLALVNTQDGSLRDIGRLKGPVQRMSFSPDGRSLAYERTRTWNDLRQQPTDIYVLELGSGTEMQIVEQVANERFVGWSPNQAEILFISQPSGTTDLLSIRVEEGSPKGIAKLIKTGLGEIRPIGMTQHGTLFYASGEGGRGTLYDVAVDFSTGEPVSPPTEIPSRFTISKSNRPKALSPDGQFLAFAYGSGGDARIGIEDLRSGRMQTISIPNVHEFRWPRWAPDSRLFWVRGFTTDARFADYLVNRATSETRALGPFSRPGESPYPWHGFDEGTARYCILRSDEKRITFVWHDVQSGKVRTEEARNIPDIPNMEAGWHGYRTFMPGCDAKTIFYIQRKQIGPGVSNWIATRRNLATGQDFEFFSSTNAVTFHHDPQTDGKAHSRPDLPILLRLLSATGSATVKGIEISGNSAKEWCSIDGPVWPWWVGSGRQLVMTGFSQEGGNFEMELWTVSGQEYGRLRKSRGLPVMSIIGTYGENHIVFEKPEPRFKELWVMENFLPPVAAAEE